MTVVRSLDFAERKVEILDLPLTPQVRVLHPNQVMIKVGRYTEDIGAFCYIQRSDKRRRQRKSREVVLSSFKSVRTSQIGSLIQVLSSCLSEEGLRPRSLWGQLASFRQFMDWSDGNGHQECLSGGDLTRAAYREFAAYVDDRFRRHQIEAETAATLQLNSLALLERMTGILDLRRGVRIVKKSERWNEIGTEPISEHLFAHALALNDALFHGLCDLVIGNKSFPYKLAMPKSLGWSDNSLWVFPSARWFISPFQRGEARAKLLHPCWCYDYESGRLATLDEIWQHYSGDTKGQKQRVARYSLRNGSETLRIANADMRSHYRRMLAMTAHNAFFTLFLANTGGNQAPAQNIETDGAVHDTTTNPGYRSVKWRAGGREVSMIVPMAFVPSLHRYLELRRFLLDGREWPYLFVSMGMGKRDSPTKASDALLPTQYNILRRIDPTLPPMGVQRIRATVSNHYKQKHDEEIEAAVLQHSPETAKLNYDAGTEAEHRNEVTLLLHKIAQKAQQVVAPGAARPNSKLLEEGGVCQSFGNPKALSTDVPVQPNCKTGCIFCSERVLVAGEEDARKVASAAFLMEQLIMGPASEAEFRPQITKCDEDLAKIRAFDGCQELVDRVKLDVYTNGNLTPYFQDKFQLFLALGILG